MDKKTDTRIGSINIGLDPGFGAFKAACIGAEGARVATVLSVVGVGSTDMGMLSVGNLGSRGARRAAQPDQVTFDMGEVRTYLVGENVARYARPLERMDFLRLSDGPELRALFYDVAFRLLGAGEHRANVICGLPVEVMADGEQARAALRALRAWMVGNHSWTVGAGGIISSVSLDINEVRVMAQPAGSYFAWGLDDRGQWARSTDDLRAPIAICDVGFCTLDLFALRGGDVIGRFTAGDTLGVRRAAELVISAVRSSYGVSLSLHEADALLRDRQPRLFTGDGEKDLRPVVGQALETTAAAVAAFCERQWGNGRQFAHLLFTGGGAEALRETLVRHYPRGVVLPSSATANALGLARYGMRVFGACK